MKISAEELSRIKWKYVTIGAVIGMVAVKVLMIIIPLP